MRASVAVRLVAFIPSLVPIVPEIVPSSHYRFATIVYCPEHHNSPKPSEIYPNRTIYDP